MLLSRQDLFTAGATGAATLIDPARLSPRLRRAYRLAMAATSGVGAVTAAGDLEQELSVPAQVALGAGVAGAVLATIRTWERMDAGTVAWLQRRGIGHPRVVLAVGATGIALASAVLEKKYEAAEPVTD